MALLWGAPLVCSLQLSKRLKQHILLRRFRGQAFLSAFLAWAYLGRPVFVVAQDYQQSVAAWIGLARVAGSHYDAWLNGL